MLEKQRFGVVLGLMLMLMWAGCKPAASRSEAFDQIFKPEAGGTFRGVSLGDELSKVKAIEGKSPKHDDQWGYVYEFALAEQGRYFVEYISKDTVNRKVNALVLNIFMEEKAVASDLFSEVEDHLRGRYGVADGNLGNFKWSHEESNTMVSLRMLDDKKSISLSFGFLQNS